MSSTNPRNASKKVRVTDVTEQVPPEQVRRISRALIALARAQLEVDAEAEHQRRQKPRSRTPGSQGDAA